MSRHSPDHAVHPEHRQSPSAGSRLLAELRELVLVALYFGCWIAALLLVKTLLLEEYNIQFHHWSMAIVGALVLSKTVLVLELVPLGNWVARQPAWIDILLRTLLYTLGVALVMLLEKGFEGRHESGGFGESLANVLQHTDIHHVWVNTLCIGGAILSFNIFSIIRGHLGGRRIATILMQPPPEAG